MDREKVIKGMECCSRVFWLCPTVACPYYREKHEFGCSSQLKKDAFELLKEQERQIIELKEKLRLMEYGDQESAQSLFMPAT